MGLVGILVGLALLIGLAYRGWSVLLLRDEGRRCADEFIAAHGPDIGKRSTYDIDELLEGQ